MLKPFPGSIIILGAATPDSDGRGSPRPLNCLYVNSCRSDRLGAVGTLWLLTPFTPTDWAISVPLQSSGRPFGSEPGRAHSLVTPPSHPRASRSDPTHLPPTLAFSRPAVRTSQPARPPAAKQPGPPLASRRRAVAPGCPSPAFGCRAPRSERAPCQLGVPWGKAVRRPPATLSPFPPAGPAPSRPAGRARQRVRDRSPARLLGSSPRWHTYPQRRPGAGPRTRCRSRARERSRASSRSADSQPARVSSEALGSASGPPPFSSVPAPAGTPTRSAGPVPGHCRPAGQV